MFKVLNFLMAAAFLFSVIVQYNDPDPLIWMAIYGLAFLACALAIAGRLHWAFPATLAVISLGWALTMAPRTLGHVRFGELFEAFEMKDERVEVAREMGGLLIIAVWMSVLAGATRRRKV